MPENNTKIIKHAITRLLARREHSKSELLKKLSAKGFDPDECCKWIDKFNQHDIQSEHRFIETFIRNKVSKGLGEARIRNELREHKLDSQLVNQVFKDMEIDWFELAKNVFEKRFAGKVSQDFKDKQKQQRFMYYRGFDHEQINYALACYGK